MKKTLNTKECLLIITLFIFVLSIIPLLIMSFYNHPAADDFNYSEKTMNVINNGGLVILIKGVLNTIKKFYMSWQGTYSAIAIMSLQPSVWGHEFYFLSTFILLGGLIFSTIFLFKQINRYLRLEKYRLYQIIILFLFITIQTVPSLVQGFYWWNGSSFYTLFYSFLLINLGLIIKYYKQKKTKKNYLLICFITILVAGGNYVTSLQQIILLTFISIYLICKRREKSSILFLILGIVGLVVSGIAPGNEVRSLDFAGISAIEAILYSFYFGFKTIIRWFTPLNIIFIFAIVILLQDSYKNIKMKFSYPLIFTLISFSVFCAQYTPTLYAGAGLGSARLTNIIYYSYYWLMISNLYYWCGWVNKKHERIYNKIKLNNNKVIIITSILMALLCIYNIKDLSTIKVLKSLLIGEAQIYDREYRERIEILEDVNIKKVGFKPFSVYPEPIFFSDIDENPKDWKNTPLARIYNKKEIKLVKSESN